jgi:hypothetical protein
MSKLIAHNHLETSMCNPLIGTGGIGLDVLCQEEVARCIVCERDSSSAFVIEQKLSTDILEHILHV